MGTSCVAKYLLVYILDDPSAPGKSTILGDEFSALGCDEWNNHEIA